VRAHLDRWFSALQARHLAELEWPEVTRALRALSSAYVQRRTRLQAGAALDGRGKRAAFALFYGPLHFAAVWSVIDALRADGANPGSSPSILDAGCGTGAGGAAWALAAGGTPKVLGLDTHPWAVTEAAWTYRFFGLDGRAARGDLATARPGPESGIVAAYTLNELDEAARQKVLAQALSGRRELLVVEPIARGITPWWNAVATDIVARGGRSDDWKLPLDMPERWRLLDRAAGFRRDHLSARSLWLPSSAR
jgi:SAM-dependent methyltransferase